jgi:hypothetical protein
LKLTAIAKAQRIAQRQPGAGPGVEQTGAQKQRAACVIIESPLEQPWADFCRSLKRPAFLLADSSFADLEQP